MSSSSQEFCWTQKILMGQLNHRWREMPRLSSCYRLARHQIVGTDFMISVRFIDLVLPSLYAFTSPFSVKKYQSCYHFLPWFCFIFSDASSKGASIFGCLATKLWKASWWRSASYSFMVSQLHQHIVSTFCVVVWLRNLSIGSNDGTGHVERIMERNRTSISPHDDTINQQKKPNDFGTAKICRASPKSGTCDSIN